MIYNFIRSNILRIFRKKTFHLISFFSTIIFLQDLVQLKILNSYNFLFIDFYFYQVVLEFPQYDPLEIFLYPFHLQLMKLQ